MAENWTYDPNMEQVVDRAPEGDVIICDVCGGLGSAGERGQKIAAVNDLLAACEMLLRSPEEDDHFGGDSRRLEQAFELAAAAVAKARGK